MTFEEAVKEMKKGKKVMVEDGFSYPKFWIENGEIVGESITLHGFNKPTVAIYVMSENWRVLDE
jgi:hypothetical protein